jgi:hypothetical protein
VQPIGKQDAVFLRGVDHPVGISFAHHDTSDPFALGIGQLQERTQLAMPVRKGGIRGRPYDMESYADQIHLPPSIDVRADIIAQNHRFGHWYKLSVHASFSPSGLADSSIGREYSGKTRAEQETLQAHWTSVTGAPGGFPRGDSC